MITTFIPEVWSARLLENLKKNLVFANLANRNYEGEIQQMGDTVHIVAPTALTIRSYTKGGTLTAEDATTGTAIDLVINKANYYNFYVDDVEKVQARADVMDSFMGEAAFGLADKADQDLITDLKTNGSSSVALTNLTASAAYEAVVDIKTALDNAKAPKQNRWLVVDPAFEGLMLKDPRFAYSYGDKAENRMENGVVAKAAGFNIYVSNNLSGELIAGVPEAIAYAEQILKTEAYRPEAMFADGVKGLHVYGSKVVRPTCIINRTYTIA